MHNGGDLAKTRLGPRNGIAYRRDMELLGGDSPWLRRSGRIIDRLNVSVKVCSMLILYQVKITFPVNDNQAQIILLNRTNFGQSDDVDSISDQTT